MLTAGPAASSARERHHYRFLCAVLTNASPEVLRPYLQKDCWDLETLIRIAADDLVLPLLYDRLTAVIGMENREAADRGIPEDSLYFLRGIRDLHAQRNEIILGELRAVAGLANEIGITPVVLKGGAQLLGGLYPAVSDRYLIDLDLLIPEPKLTALVAHFRGSGYEFDAHDVGVDCHHETALRRAGRPGVELHRSLGMGRIRGLLTASEVFRDAVEFRMAGGERVLLPSDEHLLVHHAIHAQLSNSYQRAIWPSLREAYDCWLLVGRLEEHKSRKDAVGLGEGAPFGKPIDNRPACCQPAPHVVDLHLRTVQEMLGVPMPVRPLPGFSMAWWQWEHRRMLRSAAWVRFVDPWYFVRSSLLNRVWRVMDLGRSRAGWGYVLGTPFRKSFYGNIWKELF